MPNKEKQAPPDQADKVESFLVSEYDQYPRDGRSSRIRFWLKLEHWTLDQAAMMICDIAPDLANRDAAGRLLGCVSLRNILFGDCAGIRSTANRSECLDDDEAGNSNDGFDASTESIEDLANSLQDVITLLRPSADKSTESKPVTEWMEIASRKGIEIPWQGWARRKKLISASPAILPAKTNKSGESKTVSTLLKMIAIMVTEKYAYAPKGTKNAAVKQIACAGDEQGRKIDEDTVRKWLHEATTTFPDVRAAGSKPK